MIDDDSGLDIQDLQRRARAVREFTHVEGAATFRVRFPSRFDWVALDARYAGDTPQLVRKVVEASIVGWEGVTVRDAFAESKEPDTPLPFGPDTLELVLDQQVHWLARLWTETLARKTARDAAIEASLKNSPPTSGANGSEPSAAMH